MKRGQRWRVMPETQDTDWTLGQALYNQGMPLKQIALKLNRNPSTVRAHAYRYHWQHVASTAKREIQQRTWAERGADWQGRIADLIEKYLSNLEAKSPDRIKPNELARLTGILATLNKIGRDHFGLTKPAPPREMSIGVPVPDGFFGDEPEVPKLAAG